MARQKEGGGTTRVIWRISQDHPEGVLVHSADRRRKAESPTAAPQELGFLGSSLDLLQGVEVSEVLDGSLEPEWCDTLPAFRDDEREA